MKKKHFFAILLLVAVMVLTLWLNHRPTVQVSISETNQQSQASALANNMTIGRPITNQTSETNIALVTRESPQTQAAEPGKDQWRTPIEFYGKAVDENSNALADVQIDFDCNDLSESGTSFYHAKSDTNGLFSIAGIHGKLLGVKVNKEGYYAYEPHGLDFNYAGENQNFSPDMANPVIFRLKKKGVAEQLVRFRKSFGVPKNGSPIEIDLTMGKLTISGSADLKVECWTDDRGKQSGQKFDWKCRVSLAGGGIQRYTDEFPFSAPEAGYQSSDEIDMTVKPDQPWLLDVERHYFIRTADGRYGRVAFRMIAHGEHFCQVESYFNPSGSRNLEFDPNNAIQAGQ